MIKTRNLTLNATAVAVLPSDTTPSYGSVSIENTSSAGYAYIGGSGVTTSSYGFKLYPAQVLTMDIDQYESFYICGDTGVTVAILILDKP